MPAHPFSLTAAVLATAIASAAAAQPPSIAIPLDTSVAIPGGEAACTGIGQTRDDPRWAAYPVRVEVSDAKNQYLADATIVVKDAKGRPIIQASCAGPWLLLKLAPGAYSAFAQLSNSPARPRSAPFHTPSKGQLRVVLQFPDA
jgi:hypothetical protein